MSRFGPRQIDGASPGRSSHWSKLFSVVALVSVVIVLAGCGSEVNQPYSTISPQSDKARDIQWLYQIVFWAALIVFIAVQFAIVYTVLRFRKRSNARPEQVHGSKVLEIAWTVVPALILLALFIPTVKVIFEHAAAANVEDGFNVNVIGKQWWWEVSYPDIPANPDDETRGPLVTANEVVLPVGANVVFRLQSNNVIHSFWVPLLSGKMDVIPGHDNKMQFVAEREGDYFGECAEFCGAAHAWMRFKVKVVSQEAFDAWVEAWRTPPADGNAETADVIDAPAAFGVCLACHQINGTNATIAPEGMPAISGYLPELMETNEAAAVATENEDPDASDLVVAGPGPNLTLFACRDTIGAGILKNTPENLEKWLKQTDEVKEGVYMPNYYERGQITDEQITELVNYLSGLEPADGCSDAGLPVGSELAPVRAAGTPVAATE